MKNNIVFSDEMQHPCFIVFPVRFPVFSMFFCPFFCGRNISDRCIKPNIKYFILQPGQRHFYAPVEVAGNGPGLQAMVEPRFTLSVYIGFPVVFMAFNDPLIQPVLVTGRVAGTSAGFLSSPGRCHSKPIWV